MATLYKLYMIFSQEIKYISSIDILYHQYIIIKNDFLQSKHEISPQQEKKIYDQMDKNELNGNKILNYAIQDLSKTTKQFKKKFKSLRIFFNQNKVLIYGQLIKKQKNQQKQYNLILLKKSHIDFYNLNIITDESNFNQNNYEFYELNPLIFINKYNNYISFGNTTKYKLEKDLIQHFQKDNKGTKLLQFLNTLAEQSYVCPLVQQLLKLEKLNIPVINEQSISKIKIDIEINYNQDFNDEIQGIYEIKLAKRKIFNHNLKLFKQYFKNYDQDQPIDYSDQKEILQFQDQEIQYYIKQLMKTKEFRFFQIEGKGSFGKVIKIFQRKTNGDLDFYVVKLFNKNFGQKQNSIEEIDSNNQKQQQICNFKKLKALKLDNLFMKLVIENQENINGDQDIQDIYNLFSPCLIYEAGLISLKDFHKLLQDKTININFQEYTNIFLNIQQILDQFGEKGVFHCDIQPSNIVVDSDYQIKLIDLGSLTFKPASYGRFGFTPNYCYYGPINLKKFVDSQSISKKLAKFLDLYSLCKMMTEFKFISQESSLSKHLSENFIQEQFLQKIKVDCEDVQLSLCTHDMFDTFLDDLRYILPNDKGSVFIKYYDQIVNIILKNNQFNFDDEYLQNNLDFKDEIQKQNYFKNLNDKIQQNYEHKQIFSLMYSYRNNLRLLKDQVLPPIKNLSRIYKINNNNLFRYFNISNSYENDNKEFWKIIIYYIKQKIDWQQQVQVTDIKYISKKMILFLKEQIQIQQFYLNLIKLYLESFGLQNDIIQSIIGLLQKYINNDEIFIIQKFNKIVIQLQYNFNNKLIVVLDSLQKFIEFLMEIQQYNDAEIIYNFVIEILKQILPQNHAKVYKAKNNLAEILINQYQLQGAQQNFKDCIEIRNQNPLEFNPTICIIMNNLSHVLIQKNQLLEAQQILKECIEIQKKNPQRDNINYCICVNNYGVLLQKLNRFEESQQLHNECLEIQRRILPKNHPDLVITLINLATVLQNLNKYSESQKIHNECLEIQKKFHPKDQLNICIQMNNMSAVLLSQNKFEEAIQISKQCLEIIKQILPFNHPYILSTMNNLGTILMNSNKLDEAQQIMRESIELMKLYLPKNHPHLLVSINNLSMILQSLNKLSDAQKLLKENYQNQKSILQVNHPNLCWTMNNLGSILYSLQKYDEAQIILQESLETMKQIFPVNHPDILLCMSNLGNVLTQRNKLDEAEQIHIECYEIQKQNLPKHHADICQSIINIASVLISQNKLKDALKHLIECIEIQQQILPSNHPRFIHSKQSLDYVRERMKLQNY